MFLQLAVSLKAEHYDMCLAAKICELEETFQAKLGFQIGHMYNRVGTTEWDTKYPDHDVETVAHELIEDTFVIFEERQIKEGVADLKREKTFATKTPDEIRDYIDKKNVVPWREQFQKAAATQHPDEEEQARQPDPRPQVETALADDAASAAKIDALLAASASRPEQSPRPAPR